VLERPWIYEIVSNPRNGIDVDKIDYMYRDSKKLNVKYAGFNKDLLLKNARVVDGVICYPEKYDFELKKLFNSRYSLYRDCYYHRVTQAYEGLILDILEETEGVLYDYLAAIEDPELYLDMDDSIIHEVRISTDPRLARARELVDKFDRREIYSFIAEKGLNTEVARKTPEVTEQQVIDCYREHLDG